MQTCHGCCSRQPNGGPELQCQTHPIGLGCRIKKEEVKYLLAPAVTVHNVTALEIPVHQFSLLFGAES